MVDQLFILSPNFCRPNEHFGRWIDQPNDEQIILFCFCKYSALAGLPAAGGKNQLWRELNLNRSKCNPALNTLPVHQPAKSLHYGKLKFCLLPGTFPDNDWLWESSHQELPRLRPPTISKHFPTFQCEDNNQFCIFLSIWQIFLTWKHFVIFTLLLCLSCIKWNALDILSRY